MYEMIEQYKPSDNERKYLVTYYIDNKGTYTLYKSVCNYDGAKYALSLDFYSPIFRLVSISWL